MSPPEEPSAPAALAHRRPVVPPAGRWRGASAAPRPAGVLYPLLAAVAARPRGHQPHPAQGLAAPEQVVPPVSPPKASGSGWHQVLAPGEGALQSKPQQGLPGW